MTVSTPYIIKNIISSPTNYVYFSYSPNMERIFSQCNRPPLPILRQSNLCFPRLFVNRTILIFSIILLLPQSQEERSVRSLYNTFCFCVNLLSRWNSFVYCPAVASRTSTRSLPQFAHKQLIHNGQNELFVTRCKDNYRFELPLQDGVWWSKFL